MIILDTSVVVKCILPGEDDEALAQNILNMHLSGKNQIFVPDLFYYEIANTIATKTKISTQLLAKNLKLVHSFQFKTVPLTFESLLKASQLAKVHHTSVYDMSYSLLAKEKKCKLITADRKFIAKTNFAHVIHISDYK